jgi:hypothetical protein
MGVRITTKRQPDADQPTIAKLRLFPHGGSRIAARTVLSLGFCRCSRLLGFPRLLRFRPERVNQHDRNERAEPRPSGRSHLPMIE